MISIKRYNLQLGAVIATVLATSILPVRLSEGQGHNPINLIGSEIVIWVMCATMWTATYHIYYRIGTAKWQKFVIALLVCGALSNLFYFGSNPLFEDYPLKPMRELPFWLAAVRLSIRGFLVGLIMIPLIFLLENERQQQREELDRERNKAKDAERQKQLLEVLVAERTRELERTLSVLSESQDELDHQVYLLSRVVASIAHDVNAPLRHIISGTELIGQFIRNRQVEQAGEYNQQLENALNHMATFMHNLLEFAKGQIHKGSLHMGNVNLAAVISEKARLFEQILNSKNNTLHIRLDDSLSVTSNANLLGVVLHNLLDNAIKNTGMGEIEISTDVLDDELHLLIQNAVSKTPRNGNLEQDESRTSAYWDIAKAGADGHGLGLVLVRDISTLLNVRFLIEATAGKVTARIIFNEFNTDDLVSDSAATDVRIAANAGE